MVGRRDRSQQLEGKLAADRRADPLSLEPTVQARHQASPASSTGSPAVAADRRKYSVPPQQGALQQRFCQPLDKERDTVGALDDAIKDLCRQRLASGDTVDQRSSVAPA